MSPVTYPLSALLLDRRLGSCAIPGVPIGLIHYIKAGLPDSVALAGRLQRIRFKFLCRRNKPTVRPENT